MRLKKSILCVFRLKQRRQSSASLLGYFHPMKAVIFFILNVLLWSVSVAIAQTSKNDFLPMSKIRDLSDYPVVVETWFLPNFPKARSQRFNDCFAVAGSVILDWYKCVESDPKRANCDKIPMSDRTLPLSLSGIGNLDRLREKDPDAIKYTLGSPYLTARQSLNLYGGGSIGTVLRIGVNEQEVKTEACFGYDQFANEYFSDSNLQALYPIQETDHQSPNVVGSICEVCVFNKLFLDKAKQRAEVERLLRIRGTISSKTGKPIELSTDKIIYNALFNKCTLDTNQSKMFYPDPIYRQFPDRDYTEQEKKSPEFREKSYKLALENIAAVLKSGFPVGLEPVCGRRIADGSCNGGEHGVVVNGYERRCKKSNPNDCKVLLKITNSWGETWQEQNDDGWVDAETIFKLWREQKPGGLSWIVNSDMNKKDAHWLNLPEL